MADGNNGAASSSPGAAVSIGNYKGVMLCNRPFNGVATTLAREARRPAASTNGPSPLDNSKGAFLVGNPGESLGMNVPILSEPAHAIKRDRKNTALSKHKKWLHDLQKERARLQDALAEDDARRRQRKEKFSQREAKMREAVRGNTTDDDDSDNNESGKAALQKRPMWALTKETAEEKLESLEDAEADDLIAFANNLDIDQFMDDIELKTRVAQIEQQLAQVQSIVEYEEAQEKREQQQADDINDGANPPAALTGSNLAQLERAMSKQFGRSHCNADAEDDDDARSVASSVLSECKSIRSVHSIRSVAALTRRAEAKLGQSEGGIAAPRVVTIDEEQGARMLIKHNPSNLPYIHRNPAI